MFASFSCAIASCLVIGIGLHKEAWLLLWKTSIIYSCRAFFAKSVKFISFALNSYSSPKLLYSVLPSIGLRNLSFLKRARNLWHSGVMSGLAGSLGRLFEDRYIRCFRKNRSAAKFSTIIIN